VKGRYYTFSEYLRNRFGARVYKINIDAGFGCPNRDGKISRQGCIYCDNRAFSYYTRFSNIPVEVQIKERIERLRSRKKAEKFILYFQAHTNTYASLEVLQERFNIIHDFRDIVGLSIATRPDCIDKEKLSFINSFSSQYDVWLEYGLQSVHNKTLEFINRGHTFETFLEAVDLTRKYPGIKICVHVILGLPGEDKIMMLETAKVLRTIKVEGVKIHPLHVVKGTKLNQMFSEEKYFPLGLEEYVDVVCSFLGNLWEGTVIQRLTADCPSTLLISPEWVLDKKRVLDKINERLERDNIFQGSLYNG